MPKSRSSQVSLIDTPYSNPKIRAINKTYMDTPAKSTYQCSLLCCEAVQKTFFFVLYPSCLNLNQGLKLA
jgi:hypothetical protein